MECRFLASAKTFSESGRLAARVLHDGIMAFGNQLLPCTL
jgi:hypothetical protein